MTELRTREPAGVDVRRRPSGLVALAVVFSVVLVVLGAALGSATVTSAADQRAVGFGAPIAWVHQDQRGLDPSLPQEVGLVSPWEHPTTVSTGAFVVDVVLVLALVVASGLAWTAWRRSQPSGRSLLRRGQAKRSEPLQQANWRR